MYIDDLLKVTKNPILEFADDTNLVTSYQLSRDSNRDEVQASCEFLVNLINGD